VRLIASVLGVVPAEFLYEEEPPALVQLAPVAIMQEALDNQREMKARLESLEAQLADSVALMREALRMLGELRSPKKAATGK
jgi:hypothetical protein